MSVIFFRKAAISIALLVAGSLVSLAKAPALEVIALGTGGPGAAGRASSSYALALDGKPRILVDAGGGAFARAGELGLALDDLDIVLLTHLHIDHCADLPAIFKARGVAHNGPYAFQVFGPSAGGEYPAVSQWIKLLFDKGGAFAYQPGFNAEETITPVDLTSDLAKPPATIHQAGDLGIRAVATHHGDCPSVAYRISYAGKSVTFSGDMDASALPNLTALALGTDLLVFNAVVLDPPGSPDVLYTLHSAPRQIGQAARDAKAGRLLLSHIVPVIERNRKAVLASIAKSYAGPINMAQDRAKYVVAP
jgi:ribonuclease BN (tRNA processing enzyme)